MSDDTVTLQIETAPSAADSHAQDNLSEILFTLRNFTEECRSRLTAMEERLQNQPPATVVEVTTTVEAPEPEAPQESEPEPIAEAGSIGEPVAVLTEAEVIAAESGDAAVHASETVTEVTVVAPPEVVEPKRNRTSLANLLLGKRRS